MGKVIYFFALAGQGEDSFTPKAPPREQRKQYTFENSPTQ
jgi:hypothetical protein